MRDHQTNRMAGCVRVLDLGMSAEPRFGGASVCVYEDPNHRTDPGARHRFVRREVRNLGMPGEPAEVSGVYSRRELEDDKVNPQRIRALFAPGVPESQRRWHATLRPLGSDALEIPDQPGTAVWYLADFSGKLAEDGAVHLNYCVRHDLDTYELAFYPATDRLPLPGATPTNVWTRLASVDIRDESQVTWACANVLG